MTVFRNALAVAAMVGFVAVGPSEVFAADLGGGPRHTPVVSC